MFDKNQLVEVKWSNKTRRHFESKGYAFTKYGEHFYVKAKDLMRGSKEKVEVICDFCGNPYYVSYADFNSRNNKNIDSCNNCRVKKQWSTSKNKRAKEKFDIIRKFCAEKDYELITNESEFIDAFTTIKYICKKHGVQEQSLDNMIHGHGCWNCAVEERALNCKHSIEYITSVIEGYNNNKLLNPDEYMGSNVHNLKIQCGLCGGIYTTSFSDYTNNLQIRCKSCSQSESVGEMKIRMFLESKSINFIQEKRFEDCVDKKCLPFDFYLPEHNLIIEFDGQHHFYDGGFKNYESTKRHDEIKNEYCKLHNIKLLRIPYWEGRNIENIITKQLNL